MAQFNTTKRKLYPEKNFARIFKKLLSDCHSIEFHCIPQVIICKTVLLSSSSWVPDRYFVSQIGNNPCTRLPFLMPFVVFLQHFTVPATGVTLPQHVSGMLFVCLLVCLGFCLLVFFVFQK